MGKKCLLPTGLLKVTLSPFSGVFKMGGRVALGLGDYSCSQAATGARTWAPTISILRCAKLKKMVNDKNL